MVRPLPNRFWNPAISLLNECNEGEWWNQDPRTTHIRDIMEEQPTNYWSQLRNINNYNHYNKTSESEITHMPKQWMTDNVPRGVLGLDTNS
jgi:hypothetical protein